MELEQLLPDGAAARSVAPVRIRDARPCLKPVAGRFRFSHAPLPVGGCVHRVVQGSAQTVRHVVTDVPQCVAVKAVIAGG